METELQYCINFVLKRGVMILFVLGLIGLGGVSLHIWWSRRLSFFDFSKADSTKKGDLKRLLYPLIPVSLLSFLTPFIYVGVSSEFGNCLENPEIVQYLSEFWTYILPVKGTGPGISALVCGFLGVTLYWIFGSFARLISVMSADKRR